MSKRRLSKRQKDRIQAIQERRRERANLKQTINDEELQNLSQLGPETLGTVVTNYGSQVDIEGSEEPFKGVVVRCHKRANMISLVTGDKVIWRHAEPHGVVVACEERETELIRPDIYGKLRPVAANIDRIAIVFAPKPQPHSNLLDRYLVAAEAQGIQPFLVLNKTDMRDAEDFLEVDQLIADYRFIGYEVIAASAKTAEGIAELQDYLAKRTSIFVGQSGVGKSSLLNCLQPQANSLTAPLSEAKQEGTHTTTVSKLYHLNGGGILIDSPGIREFALTHLSQEKILDGFVDFRPYLGRCKFRDCQHQQEKGCALLEAVRDKKVLAVRLNNYRQIILSQEQR
ncbi:MAG: small ribosomal subunit biogenesis GTPase RsgA [Porticoccaceae bacterium]|nr:small ribosomal subunit biogenesis GTPase RsgA [Porticoccaceae bacterium]